MERGLSAPSPALTEILQSRRDSLNARFDKAKASNRRLDGEEFLELLGTTFLPAAEKLVAENHPVAAEQVERLYSALLALFERRLIGMEEVFAGMRTLWSDVIPSYLDPGNSESFSLPAKFCNAYLKIESVSEGLGDRWVREMSGVSSLAGDPESALAAGEVSAWLSGMAQFRERALNRLELLSDRLFHRLLFGEEGSGNGNRESIIERLRRNPWYNPRAKEEADTIQLVCTAGMFRGFGGQFWLPPLVWAIDGQWIVSVGSDYWVLVADAFGHYFQRIDPLGLGDAADSPKEITVHRKGYIQIGRKKSPFPECEAVSSYAVIGDAVAVTSDLSHSVFVFRPVK